MSVWLAKARVVLTALPTHITTLVAVIVFLSPEIAKILPDKADLIARITVTVLAVLAGAITVIRKVTPVSADQVGLLLQGPPASPVVVIDKPEV